MASNRQKGNGGRWKGRQKLEKSDTEIIYQEKNITLCFARGCIIISKPVLSAEMRTEASGGTDTEGSSRKKGWLEREGGKETEKEPLALCCAQ